VLETSDVWPFILAAAAVVLVTDLLEDTNAHLANIVKYMPSESV
jgi:hypothetical protein